MRLALINSWLTRISIPLLVLGHLLLAILARYRIFSDSFLKWGFGDSILLAQGFLVVCCAQLTLVRWQTRWAATGTGILALVLIHNPPPIARDLFLTAMMLATVTLSLLRSLRFGLSTANDGSKPGQFSIRAALLGVTLVAVYILNLQQVRAEYVEPHRKIMGIVLLGTNFTILSLATIWAILSQKSPWGRTAVLATIALLMGFAFPIVIDQVPQTFQDVVYLWPRLQAEVSSASVDVEGIDNGFLLLDMSQWRWHVTSSYIAWNVALTSQLALSLVMLRNSGLRIVQSTS